jgi:hypothetical protein
MERRLVIGLAAALGVALLAIAFLLGRESRSPSPAAVSAPTPEPLPLSPTPESTVAPADMPADIPAAVPATPTAVVGEGVVPPPSAAEPTAEASTLRGAADPVRADVARYFAEVEALQQGSKGWSGDPNAAAQQIMRQATSGDTSGFKSLAEANRQLAERLRAVAAPEPCAAHRQKTLDVLEQANTLLEKLQAAVQSTDTGGLTALTAQSQDLERRARDADALATAIKQRYGL